MTSDPRTSVKNAGTTRVLKSFLKCLAFAYVSAAAGYVCGYPLIGLFVGLVPVMVGFLWIWDYVEETTKDCWVCGRTTLTGRHMYLQDWYKRGRDGDGKCGHCGRELVQAGDRIFGKHIDASAA